MCKHMCEHACMGGWVWILCVCLFHMAHLSSLHECRGGCPHLCVCVCMHKCMHGCVLGRGDAMADVFQGCV